MQGVVYPEANVLFSAQTEDPAALERPPVKDPAMATDPLVSVFGGWQAIENSALALAGVRQFTVGPRPRLFERRARSNQRPGVVDVRGGAS